MRVINSAFAVHGKDLFDNFDQLPTWTYATPHNIQLPTPQADSCNAYHNNPAWFLTADKVSPEELKANQSVIAVPPPPISPGDRVR